MAFRSPDPSLRPSSLSQVSASYRPLSLGHLHSSNVNMIASQVYPSVPKFIEGDAQSEVSSSIDDSYPGFSLHNMQAVSSTGQPIKATEQYCSDPYMTPPYTTSTFELPPWATSSIPEIQSTHFSTPQIPGMEYPRSSYGHFSPSTPQCTQWSNGLDFGVYSIPPQIDSSQINPPQIDPLPIDPPQHDPPQNTPTYTANVLPSYGFEEQHITSTTPSPGPVQAPRPQSSYIKIAPSVPNKPSLKRRASETDDQQSQNPQTSNSTQSPKRRKPTASSSTSTTTTLPTADLGDDDRFLIQLKEDRNLPWKDIAARFQSDKGKAVQVAALQMRYKRLREKFRVWRGQDLAALRLAVEHWEKAKWDIISAKMVEFGISERWSARHCARMWQKLESSTSSSSASATATPTTLPVPSHPDPGLSHFSSPVQSDPQFGFLQLHPGLHGGGGGGNAMSGTAPLLETGWSPPASMG